MTKPLHLILNTIGMGQSLIELELNRVGLGSRWLILVCGFVNHWGSFQYVARPWRLEDSSMEPTFHDGDVVLTTALNSKLQKDDIVILKDPFRPDQKICKRVLGEILRC